MASGDHLKTELLRGNSERRLAPQCQQKQTYGKNLSWMLSDPNRTHVCLIAVILFT